MANVYDEYGVHFSLYPKQQLFLAHPDYTKDIPGFITPKEVLFGGSMGSAKAEPLSSKVCTPFGFKTMGEMKVGTLVNNPDGSVAKVIQIHPQGVKDIYKVTFSDGSFARCTAEHLWLVHFTKHRVKAQRRYIDLDSSQGIPVRGRLATTEELIAFFAKRNKDKTYPVIPLTQPVEFTRTSSQGIAYLLPIDPYALGALLGDGCMSQSGQVVFTSIDPEIIVNLELGLGVKLSQHQNLLHFGIPDKGGKLRKALDNFCLLGKTSIDKHIPENYLYASIASRWALLQGLMDTDGTVGADADSSVSYSTISVQLAKDVKFLVESLGGRCTIKEHTAGYRDKQGEHVQTNNVFTCYIQLSDASMAFRLARKKERCFTRFNGGNSPLSRRMVSIVPDGREEAQCITVDHPNGLYLTDDFIVTHNSFSLRAISVIVALECPGVNVYLFRKTYGELISNHLDGPNGYRAWLSAAVKKKLVRIDSSANIIYFKNGPNGGYAGGSQIFLRHLQHEKDMHLYQGAEMHVLMIDEATHFSMESYVFLRTRVRLGSWSPPEKWKGWFPRILMGSNPGGQCLPYGRVLTTHGWKDISEVTSDDCVVSVNPNTFATEIKPVIGTSAYYTEEPLVHIKNKKLDILCTSGHKIPTMPDAKVSPYFKLTPFNELPNQSNIIRVGKPFVGGRQHEYFEVAKEYAHTSNRFLKQPLKIKYRDYAKFMGWYLSEGCSNVVGNSGTVFIAQSKADGVHQIKELLDTMQFTYHQCKDGFAISSYEWATYLVQFGVCDQKFIPRELLGSTDIDALFQTLMMGDGSYTKNGDCGYYYTTSQQLRDDFMELCIKFGYVTHYDIRKHKIGDTINGKIVKSRRISYVISFHITKHGITEFYTGNKRYANRKEMTSHKSNCSYVPYSGMVYCIEVADNHNFIVEQHNRIWLSGNSHLGYKQMFVDFMDKANPFKPKWAPADDGGMLRQYIPGTVYDNPALLKEDPGYIDRLKGLGSPELVKAMLEGDWDIVAGGMFDDVWDSKYTVIQPFKIPENWYINRGFDWGSAVPFACLWFAESNGEEVELASGEKASFPRGTLFVVEELYGNSINNKNPDVGVMLANQEIGFRIRYTENNSPHLRDIAHKIQAGPADNQIFNVMSNDTIARGLNAGYWGSDSMKDVDIFFTSDKTAGSRVKRWSLMRDRFKAVLNLREGKPMENAGLIVFSNCLNTIRTLPTLPRKQNDPEDIMDLVPDHIADVIGYRCLQRGSGFGRLKVKFSG